MHALSMISTGRQPREWARNSRVFGPSRLTSSQKIDHTLLVSLAQDGLFFPDPDGARAPADVQGHGPLTALAKEALGNDPDKVRRFLDAIAPTVRRTCRGVMGGSHPDLEDAVQ